MIPTETGSRGWKTSTFQPYFQWERTGDGPYSITVSEPFRGRFDRRTWGPFLSDRLPPDGYTALRWAKKALPGIVLHEPTAGERFLRWLTR